MTHRKDAILDSAQAVILEKGFTAATIDEICARAGVTKGSFFHYFKNKEHLGTEVLDRYAQTTGQSLMAFVDRCGPDPRDRLLGYIDAVIQACQDPNTQGCLVGTMTQELHATNPRITCCCGHKFNEMRQVLLRELEGAQAKYGSTEDEDVDLPGLADLFLATLQGGLILMKATGDRQAVPRVLQHYRRYVSELFNKNLNREPQLGP